jgi:hypothetical protein
VRYADAFPNDEELPLVQLEQKQRTFPVLTKQEYIAVLENERETLLRRHFNSEEGGTGDFNTAASVLEHRINEIKAQL